MLLLGLKCFVNNSYFQKLGVLKLRLTRPLFLGAAPEFACYELLLALRFFVNMGPGLLVF